LKQPSSPSVRKLAHLIAAMALAIGFSAFAAAPAAAAVKPLALCGYAAMDTPHVSSGAGGVIAKYRYCGEQTDTVSVHLYLFLCPVKPSSNEQNWESQGCVVQAYFDYSWTASAGTTYTRYVPPSGTPGAHGTGWWVACAVMSQPYSAMIPSAPAYISA
jgi:hypothetical protein